MKFLRSRMVLVAEFTRHGEVAKTQVRSQLASRITQEPKRRVSVWLSAIFAVSFALSARAALPSLAQCAAPDYSLYIAGSPAAQYAFSTTIATDLFGDVANLATYSASQGNFKAYCGFAAATNSAGIPESSVVTIHYRGEGGFFVGAVPVVSGAPIKFLDLTQSSQITGFSVSVIGSSAANDVDDSWTGALAPHVVEVGISDLEPTTYGEITDYPTFYSATAYGDPTPWQVGIYGQPLFQQVFGIFVNTAGINGGSSGQTLSLTAQAVSNILRGQYNDWSIVPSATGAPVSGSSMPITEINQVPGSGERIATEIYFLNGCSNYPYLFNDPTPDGDAYSTVDALTLANITPGSITYASIDNAGSMPNLTLVSLDGIVPSTQAAVTGLYQWWYEATIQSGTISSPGGTVLYNWLYYELASAATMPHSSQVMAIPFFGFNGNPATLPATTDTFNGQTIYINPYTRNGTSCGLPYGFNIW